MQRSRRHDRVFFTPRGRALYEVPPAPELPADATDPADLTHPADPARPVQDPAQVLVQNLVRGNRDRGVVPDGWAAAPRWHRDGDIPWAIEAAAREALDPWDDEALDPWDPEDPCDDEDASAEREAPAVGQARTCDPASPETVDPRDPISAVTA